MVRQPLKKPVKTPPRTLSGLPASSAFIPVAVFLLIVTISVQLVSGKIARGAEFSSGMLPLVTDQVKEETALKPHLSYFVDRHGRLTLEDILSPSYQNRFIRLSDGLPPTTVGALWLRLTMVSTAGRPTRALEVNLGPNLPQDRYRVYMPEAAEPRFLGRLATNWKSLALDGSPSFRLPGVESQPVTIYIRLEGVPHLWFAPVVNIEGAQTNHNSNVQLVLLGITALAAVIAFARGIFQNNGEKIWCGVYSVILMLQIHMPVVSTAKGVVSLPSTPFVLAPGLALLILPQLGRVRMGTEGYAPRSDLILRMSSWLGAILALLPLTPGLAWVTRYLMFWPALCLPLLLATALCLIIGLEGAFGYFLCAALSMAGVLAGLFFMGWQSPPLWASFTPLLALALGALVLALASCPSGNRRHPFKKNMPDNQNRAGGSSDRAGLSVLESTGRNAALSLTGESETGDVLHAGSSDGFVKPPFPETGDDASLPPSTLTQPGAAPGQMPGHAPFHMPEEMYAPNTGDHSGQIPGQTYNACRPGNDARISGSTGQSTGQEPTGQPGAGALETLRADAEEAPAPYGDPAMQGYGSSFLGLSLPGELKNDLLRPYTAESHPRKQEPEFFPYAGAPDNFSHNSGGVPTENGENGPDGKFSSSKSTHEFHPPRSDSYDIERDDQKLLPGFAHSQAPAFNDHAKGDAPRSGHAAFYDEPIYIEEPNQYQSGYTNQSPPHAAPYWREPEAENASGAAAAMPEPFFERPAPDQRLTHENLHDDNNLAGEALDGATPGASSAAGAHAANAVTLTVTPAQSEKRARQDQKTSPPRLTLNLSLSPQTLSGAKPAPKSPGTTSPAPQTDEIRPEPEESAGRHASLQQPGSRPAEPAAPQAGKHLGLIADDEFTGLVPEPIIPPAPATEAPTPPPGEAASQERSLEVTPDQLGQPESSADPAEFSPYPATPVMEKGEQTELESPEASPLSLRPHADIPSELASRPLTPEDEALSPPKVLLPPKAVEAFSGPLSELLRNLAALSSCSLAPMAKAHAESAAKSGEALMEIAQRFGMAHFQNETPSKDDKRPFDIYKMLNELHEENSAAAQQKSLGLSWFASPRLSHRFEGDGARLKSILDALLKDSIQASSKGNVQFSARLTADSSDPGMITFTISDSRPFSSRYDPSENQASLEAIKFADATGGVFNTSNNQNNGTVVSFSAHFNPLGAPQKNWADSKTNVAKDVKAGDPSLAEAVEQVINLKKPLKPVYAPTRISNNALVLDMAIGSRRHLLNLLNQLGVKCQALRFAPEALDAYAQNPTPLVTVNADMPESDLASFISGLKNLERQNNLGPVKVLAIAGNVSQSQRLLSLGCSQVILKPLTLDNVRDAVASLSPELFNQTAPEERPDPMRPPMRSDASIELALQQPSEDKDHAVRDAEENNAAPESPVSAPSASPATVLEVAAVSSVSAVAGEPASVAPMITLAKTSAKTSGKLPDSTDFIGLTGSIEPPVEATAALPDASGISAGKNASLEYLDSIMANPVIPDKSSLLPLSSLPVTEIRSRPAPPAQLEQTARLIPVPGLDYEGIEPELIPLLPGFIADVGEALLHASQARDRQSIIDVQEAVARLAGKAQSFGLSKLEGIAACVGRAAAADDIAAVSDLMLELDNTTSKHIEALRNFYNATRAKASS